MPSSVTSLTSNNLAQFYTSALKETLDSVVSPEVREVLLLRALKLGELDEVPADPVLFQGFLAGPMRQAMAAAMGPELSDTLVAELEHVFRSTFPPARRATDEPDESPSQPIGVVVLKQTPSQSTLDTAPRMAPLNAHSLPDMRAPSPIPAPVPSSRVIRTQPTAPASHKYPSGTARALGLDGPDSTRHPRVKVYVATRNPEFASGLSALLEADAEVNRVSDVMELLRHLDGPDQSRSVVVVDCKHSSLRPIALAALAEDLPSFVQVLLWGATSAVRAQLVQLVPTTKNWLSTGESDDLRTLAARCAALVS